MKYLISSIIPTFLFSPFIHGKKTHKGHAYVDLGLSVKWATCNVGATKPEEYGDYFAWGETKPKVDYRYSNLKYCSDSTGDRFTKYVASSEFGAVDNKTTLDLSDDAAHVNWGGSWRMPTDAELTELTANCYLEWTSNYNGTGVAGFIVYKVKSDSDKGKHKNQFRSAITVGSYTTSDTHIFLPATGSRCNSKLFGAGTSGDYWSSSLCSKFSYYAYCGHFCSICLGVGADFRANGQSVRPVCP